MVYYKQQRGSPCINPFAEAGSWLNVQENQQLNLDNIERSNTKWVFVEFSNIAVKVVLARQPLLGTGSLQDWLRNLARGRVSKLILLDTFNDNLCLWRCIAVHRGVRSDQRVTKDFFMFKLRTAPNNVPKTSLDELDQVERHLNDWLARADRSGIRVYELERQENSEIQ